jgi:hypothetical protein
LGTNSSRMDNSEIKASYDEDLNCTGMKTNLKLKGIGISFIDNQPKELLYVSLNDLQVIYNYNTTK